MAAYKYLKHTASEVDAAVDSQREHCNASDLHVCAEDKAALANLVNSDAITCTTLGMQCKNLLEPKHPVGYTQNTLGVSCMINEDYSITASGTLTGTAAFAFSETHLNAGSYVISSSRSFNMQLYKDSKYVAGYNVTPSGTEITMAESGTYSFMWYFGTTGNSIDSTIFPLLTTQEVTDRTYAPYKKNIDARISALEPLADVIYKKNRSNYATFDTGYILRVGNQVHLNCTLTIRTACNAWVCGIVLLPIRVKTPDESTRYTLKQTQADGRETSIYLSNGDTSFYSSTAFKVGDVITIPPMILDLFVEETAAAVSTTSTSEPTE